jgi:hypothetical protein
MKKTFEENVTEYDNLIEWFENAKKLGYGVRVDYGRGEDFMVHHTAKNFKTGYDIGYFGEEHDGKGYGWIANNERYHIPEGHGVSIGGWF